MHYNHVGILQIVGSIDRVDCDICRKAKSTVKSHAIIADRKATEPGQVVSADILDGRSTNAHGGFKFASVIVDQYSYWTSVAILPDKSAASVLQHVKAFNISMRNSTGHGIKIFRSDRGLEYNNTTVNLLQPTTSFLRCPGLSLYCCKYYYITLPLISQSDSGGVIFK